MIQINQPKDIIINGTTLDKILENHSHWLKKDCVDWEDMRANLSGADLCNANLSYANLRYADLCNADLSGVNLSGAKSNYRTIGLELACPAEGSFIAYKKCNDYIIKLNIPADAKRSSATTRKCRCSKAEVLEIKSIKDNTTIPVYEHNAYNQITRYEVGEMVYPDSYDDNRWNECSHGIHFFMSEHDALTYN